MPMDCTCILWLLLLVHWTHTFSLHSLLYSNDEQFLDQQHFESPSPLIERLRRWSKSEDHDEIEIPLNETLLPMGIVGQKTTINSIENSTLADFGTSESNSSIIERLDDVLNSTFLTTIETASDENRTISHPLLQQDLVELHQTNVSVMENVLQENRTETKEINFSSTMISESLDFNQTVLNEKDETTVHQNDTQPDEVLSSSSLPQTTDQVETTTAIQDNQTIATGYEWINPSNISLKDTIVANQEIQINETELIPIESDPKSTPLPICDDSCQCLKECPYGFEILNDTCLCNPPCKNYQCFGDDTCIVTDKGQPLCQPQNGTQHERPTRCYQPRDAGYHDTNLRYYNRWYYNPEQDTCHLFVYRGLSGNENNFQTLNECHLECITCAPLPDPGECLGHTNMWYFDKKENQCKQFEYSGCKGNENKFSKKEQCTETCINRILYL